MSRPKVPDRIAVAVLADYNHTCCICRERKHVQLHHIDGDESNDDPTNLAVLCLDDHSRVTGNEGLGRQYSVAEVRVYKRRWEAICTGSSPSQAGEEQDEPEEPIYSKFQSRLLRKHDNYSYEVQLEEGQELDASISADDYIAVSICSPSDFKKWLAGDELMEYEGDEDIRECELSFVADRDSKYLLLLINEGSDDVDVTVDIVIWDAEAEGDEGE
jgi:hypothetical protein